MSGLPIARRIQAAANDARQSGHHPVVARISPSDMKQFDMWLRQQNFPSASGLPRPVVTKENFNGLRVVEDAKVRDVIVFDMKKK